MTAYVYVVYDAEQRPIYVGSTQDVFRRMEQHVTDSWWIDQAVKVKAFVLPDVPAARAEEQHLVRELHPRWNLHLLPPRRSWTREQYHDFLTSKAMQSRPTTRLTGQIRRIKAEYRYRFGCEVMIPAALLPEAVAS